MAVAARGIATASGSAALRSSPQLDGRHVVDDIAYVVERVDAIGVSAARFGKILSGRVEREARGLAIGSVDDPWTTFRVATNAPGGGAVRDRQEIALRIACEWWMFDRLRGCSRLHGSSVRGRSATLAGCGDPGDAKVRENLR